MTYYFESVNGFISPRCVGFLLMFLRKSMLSEIFIKFIQKHKLFKLIIFIKLMALKKISFNQEWYDKLISKTDEKGLLLSKFKELLSDKGYKSCLEIGMGSSPYFAEKLHVLFEDYTIIEKEKYSGTLPKNVKIIQKKWEDTKISKKYDVIIASHVVYYFDNNKEAIKKMIDSLTEKGILIIVVNGDGLDYGPLKKKFSDLIKEKYVFTYHKIKDLINNESYVEYTAPSTILFEDSEDLFNTLKLSFDAYPEEYLKLKKEIIEYFDKNIQGNEFQINQKIIVINK